MPRSSQSARQSPNKPLSPAVYRRRRIAALIALVLVGLLVWGLITFITGLFSSDDSASPKPAPSPSPTATSTPDPSATGTTPRECTVDEVGLAVSLDHDEISVGTPTAFVVTWTNKGEVACLVDGGWGFTNLQIVSGSDNIWNSTHCSAESVDLFLAAGEDYSRTYVWDQERSQAGCENTKKVTKAGTYRVTVGVAGALSPEVPFILK